MNKFNKNILGFWLYIISDCIMFSVLFISFLNSNDFFYKHIIFNYRTLLIETILLLICSYLSVKSIKKNELKYYYLNLIISVLFLLIEFKDIYHLNSINLNFKTNNFLSNYFVIIFFHAFHVIISILLCINLIFLKIIKKKFKIINIIFSLFWHFIHIIWLCLMFIIYIKK
ncbi:cytochrome c oxidase subunit 3 [Candidatus Carsonella ruddii]|uniref:cytochrome c oxidase subunit 3 n=1 Tax=Carsonella ruddii TaxID=114186 RepID=UPI003D417038